MSKTQSHRAYNHLKSRLMSGDLAPGTRILYGPVGKALGMSATPVREAIGLLVNEGFVDLVPQLGAVVRQIDREELIELYEMREALEPFAAEKAAERMGEQQLQTVKNAYAAMLQIADAVAENETAIDRETVRAFEEQDFAFHKQILKSCGNEIMIRTVENSHVLTRVFSTERHRYDAGVMRSTCDDHAAVLAALESRDGKKAFQAMRKHIRHGRDKTLRAKPERRDRRWR